MITLPRAILISLAVFGDVVSALPLSKRQSWNFWFGSNDSTTRFYNRQSYYNSLSKLLKTKYIEKVVKGDRVIIRITPEGLKFLSVNLDLEKFSRKAWDKKWRVVIFDVSEKHRWRRDDLREKLRGLGFGMLQESVWISPFPIEDELTELFQTLHMRGQVLVSRSHILIGNQKEMARRVWHLDKTNGKYLRILNYWNNIPVKDRDKKRADKFRRNYLDIIIMDPFLPTELLPDRWAGDKAKSVYREEVKKILGS